jgi:hypothetical protein
MLPQDRPRITATMKKTADPTNEAILVEDAVAALFGDLRCIKGDLWALGTWISPPQVGQAAMLPIMTSGASIRWPQ